MIVDSVSDFVGFALGACVQPPNNALKLGELPHHFGRQITLGEFRSPIGLRDVSKDHTQIEPVLREPPANGADTFHLVAVTAEPRFVCNAFQFRQIVGEPTFLVCLPKELRVGKSRAKNTLVSGTDQALGILTDVDNRQEVRGQFPALVLHGEILLVVTHDGDQDLVRQAKKSRIEIALNDCGVFVEISDQLSK